MAIYKKTSIRSIMMEDEELDKAEIVLAAKNISSNIQSIAEKIAKISVEDMMSLSSTINDQFGSDIAKGFNDSVKPALSKLLQEAENAKTSVDDAIDQLRKGEVPSSSAKSDLEKDSEDDIKIEPSNFDNQDDDNDADSSDEKPAKTKDEFKLHQSRIGGNAPLGRTKKDESMTRSEKAILEKAKIVALNVRIDELQANKPKGYLEKIKSIKEELNRLKNPHDYIFEKIKDSVVVKNSNPKAKELYEEIPPGFPEDVAKKLLKRYHKDPAKAYATMWKIHDESAEKIDEKMKVLESAKNLQSKLTRNLIDHKAIFRQKLREGAVVDPMNLGYGLAGEVINKDLENINCYIEQIANDIKDILYNAALTIKAREEATNNLEGIMIVIDETPFAIINNETNEWKYFENERLRDYWLEMNPDVDVTLIEPEHLVEQVLILKSKLGLNESKLDSWSIDDLRDQRRRLKEKANRSSVDNDHLQKLNDAINKKLNLKESAVFEKWKGNVKLNPKKLGMWDGWTLADLKAERKKLKDKPSRTDAESTKLREINFAIRAKTGWGKIKESNLNEKWGTKDTVNPNKKGMWDGWSLEKLRAERKKLKDKPSRTDAESTKLREINFAIRAKTGWGKIKESNLNEKWGTKDTVNPNKKGMWDGWSLEKLRAERKKLKDKPSRTDAESTKLREINFAIRAKTGWGKV